MTATHIFPKSLIHSTAHGSVCLDHKLSLHESHKSSPTANTCKTYVAGHELWQCHNTKYIAIADDIFITHRPPLLNVIAITPKL